MSYIYALSQLQYNPCSAGGGKLVAIGTTQHRGGLLTKRAVCCRADKLPWLKKWAENAIIELTRPWGAQQITARFIARQLQSTAGRLIIHIIIAAWPQAVEQAHIANRAAEARHIAGEPREVRTPADLTIADIVGRFRFESVDEFLAHLMAHAADDVTELPASTVAAVNAVAISTSSMPANASSTTGIAGITAVPGAVVVSVASTLTVVAGQPLTAIAACSVLVPMDYTALTTTGASSTASASMAGPGANKRSGSKKRHRAHQYSGGSPCRFCFHP